MAFRNRSADVSRFSMVPRADIPRSVFMNESTHKTSFNATYLIPVYVDEILPGDSAKLRMTAFCRMSTPVVPVMDNLYLDSFFFFVPNRLVWDHWENFMGEEASPGDSGNPVMVYQVPQLVSPVGGWGANTIQDYMGVPPAGQIDPAGQVGVNALFFRAYNLIFNEWFRDQNLQLPMYVPKDDGPDADVHYMLAPRGKRHDYFTSALPWPQKPNAIDTTQGLAVAGGAPVTGIGASSLSFGGQAAGLYETGGGATVTYPRTKNTDHLTAAQQIYIRVDSDGYPDVRVTINAMRQAFAVQRLLERDARGGTRYGEIIRSHFGVTSPDARLQRPEYLGGGSTPITIAPIAQTSATAVTGSTTPLGKLGAIGTGVVQNHGFTGSFTEHGMIIGLVNVRADVTYQQGLARMFSRKNKYEYYWPAFAHLGEQAIMRGEIYCKGTFVNDQTVFGYQERWAEYRYKPNRLSGFLRSAGVLPAGQATLDYWHFAEKFLSAPVLSAAFIESQPPIERVLAVSSPGIAPQFLFDALFSVRMTRPIPARSVPGLSDHF